MFNSPVLDVTIGLVFIFLLYSLLATSINESIATALGLRARMLKSAIINRMLANVPRENMWKNVARGFMEFFLEVLKFFKGSPVKQPTGTMIGDHFYDHPIIKNYGASGVFPLPSYISATNFSTVLKEVLKQEFNERLDEISAHKVSLSSGNDSRENIKQNLLYSPDMVKIKEVIEYYGRQNLSGEKEAARKFIIDEETLKILLLHLHDSGYDLEKFSKQLEGWFNDTMDRVSGWYKRQTQTILFIIGIMTALLFNVDTIGITRKLSKDKEAREKAVQLAIQSTDKYKDDPRVKKTIAQNGVVQYDTSTEGMKHNQAIFQQYQHDVNSIITSHNQDIDTVNAIIALGWGDYGMKRDSAKVISAYLANAKCRGKNSPVITASSSDREKQKALHYLYEHHWLKYKVGYVLSSAFNGRKILGFILTAFAISLGAPFWFDLLNKFVKLRTSGKKEDSNSSGGNANESNQPLSTPIVINTQTGEGAVG